MLDTVVDVTNLSRRFGEKIALADVTLSVPPGSVFGLVGENGAGKSTLIKHLLGLWRVEMGSVRVFGADPVQAAIDETGGAVVLCSVTTIIGYSSLQTSASRALESFGQVAILGEFSTMLAAQILLPAAFVLILRRRARSTAAAAS